MKTIYNTYHGAKDKVSKVDEWMDIAQTLISQSCH
ncbi:hypothetical protein C8N42_101193 [Celeribacter persicus]|jgi:hypothetical protein|uniref:Uncharacterized protein n=1 Tax=Celeribacter persicus TaxID=1651082 RepID=A0A2T5HVR1_9RHOB|nr:hypothetical protein C8N42_101193 [Celeribacter persicus]